MSKTNTGLMLSEIQGPLTHLLSNFNGEHANYWLECLKKMLRKEEIPTPPVEVLEAIQSKNKSKEKIDLLIKFIESIPAVIDLEIAEHRPNCLLVVSVHSSVRSFSGLKDYHVKYNGIFVILHDFSVIYEKSNKLKKKENELFNDFLTDYGEQYKNIEEFSKALYGLGILYEKNIPETPNL